MIILGFKINSNSYFLVLICILDFNEDMGKLILEKKIFNQIRIDKDQFRWSWF